MPVAKTKPAPQPGFDPDKHCGAKIPNQDRLCMQPKGFKTDHVGEGRCKYHGGATPIVHGRYSKIERTSIVDKAAEYERDPDLLNIDREIAYLRAVWDRMVANHAQQVDSFEDFMEAIRTGDDEAVAEMGDTALDAFPSLNMEFFNHLVKAVRTSHEMRYAKKYSVPVEELNSIMLDMFQLINDVFVRWNIPQEARIEIANKLRTIRGHSMIEGSSTVVPQLEDGE